MRGKVIYCDMKRNSIKTETYGLKCQKRSPPFKELAILENNLIELVKNIKFRAVQNQLQRMLFTKKF